MSQKYLVTSALPYANGPCHLGHIAGAYLPADIYVRFMRLLGNDVVYICGTDEHGVPITLKAEEENVTPTTIVKRYHKDIRKAMDGMGIAFDNFSGTSYVHNKYHAALSRDFFMNLLQADCVVSRLSDQYYCPQCSRFLADRYIEGTCPNPQCSYPKARGDECPQCNNTQFNSLDLKNPKCKICSQVPEIKSTKNWYLRLDAMQGRIGKWLHARKNWKENVVNFVKGWLKQGLKERAITRDLYWGVPVPLTDAAGKVLYVWFDAPIGYISSTMEWAKKQGNPDKWKEYWQNPDCRIVHFLGKDNVFFHAISWPAMLMEQKDYQLPWQIPANEYLNFGVSSGSTSTKASKSVGNVVWVHEALAAFSQDMIRYYLAANAPEKQDALFTWKHFQSKCNDELLGILGNLANRVLKFIAANFDGKIPAAEVWTERDKEFLAQIRATPQTVQEHYQKFSVRNAVNEIIALARLGNQYLDEKAPWKSIKDNRDDCQTCLFVGVQLVNALAVMLSPIIPEATNKLWQQLGNSEPLDSWQLANREITTGHTIGKAEGLFRKIEDSEIQPLEDKLAQAIQKDPPKEQVQQEPKIAFEDFCKLQLRIAEIVEAQKVPKAKKLLQLTIDLGTETRNLMAGIAEYYEPQQLIGKKVPIVANLQPRKIRGLLSEGMMLCADINGRPILLTPEEDVPPGTNIR